MNCPVSTCTDLTVEQLHSTAQHSTAGGDGGVSVNCPVSTCTDLAVEQLHSTAQQVGMAGGQCTNCLVSTCSDATRAQTKTVLIVASKWQYSV